jgi:hypothetical protein
MISERLIKKVNGYSALARLRLAKTVTPIKVDSFALVGLRGTP